MHAAAEAHPCVPPCHRACRIKAQRLAHEGKPATEIVELGAGPTPDDAYRVRLLAELSVHCALGQRLLRLPRWGWPLPDGSFKLSYSAMSASQLKPWLSAQLLEATQLTHMQRQAAVTRKTSPVHSAWWSPQDAEERQSEALEIALLNRSIKQRGGGGMAYDPDDPEGGWGGLRPAAQMVSCEVSIGWVGWWSKGGGCFGWTPGLQACDWIASCVGWAGMLRSKHRVPSELLCGNPAAPPALLCAAPVPAGRALDAAEHLLVKCRPLAAQWGTERFGLADPSVLQAIEVCAGYH